MFPLTYTTHMYTLHTPHTCTHYTHVHITHTTHTTSMCVSEAGYALPSAYYRSRHFKLMENCPGMLLSGVFWPFQLQHRRDGLHNTTNMHAYTLPTPVSKGWLFMWSFICLYSLLLTSFHYTLRLLICRYASVFCGKWHSLLSW